VKGEVEGERLANVPARVRSVLIAALEAVDPLRAVRSALRREGSLLRMGGEEFDLDAFEHVWVVGAGKAGAPMAQAVEEVMSDRVAGGVVVVKYGHAAPTQLVEVREAGHPVPDAAGLLAGEEVLALAHRAGAKDLVICLLSGGGSALLEALPDGMVLEDLKQVTSLLLASGATINEMNCVRKHLSLIKGGLLARAVAPAQLVTLVLSDVVGSPLDVIASGPTVADASTWEDAWAVVERYALVERLPEAVRLRLATGRLGGMEDTPKQGNGALAQSLTMIVGDNSVAAEAAKRSAEEQGFSSLIVTTFMEGEAREAARFAVAVAREVQAHDRPVPQPACVIFGGETTVTLGEKSGKGGRNQELAVAAAALLEGTAGITLVALATDGSDGPTDSAGGIVDGSTVAQARDAGVSVRSALEKHDAYPFLSAAGGLLVTGPTRTNVNDLVFVFVE
jgi:hydroxypyruvate reductase